MHLLFLSLLISCLAFADQTPQTWIPPHLSELVTLYKSFHEAPELSLHEFETGKKVAKLLEDAGVHVTYPMGKTGVVGLLENGPGPTLLIRTDLDGLPVKEKTGLPYASKVTTKNSRGEMVGVMHACGHDIHITNFIGVARYLSANRKLWSGKVLFVAQPAEETGQGASALLKDGLYKKFPKPDFALALHVSDDLEAGKIGYHAGPTLANVDSFDIILHGKGGHGAEPQATIDPVVMASQFVLALQTLVSRENNPLEPAVVTVGVLQCGTKRNLIADDCLLQLTVRSFTSKVREHLLEGIARKAKAVALSFGASEPTIKHAENSVPALYNDPALVSRLVPVFEKALGKDNVVESPAAMGGEDFSRYSQGSVPVFMFRLGAVNKDRLKHFSKEKMHPPSLHSSEFFPDPAPTLQAGIVGFSSAALALLPVSRQN